MPKKKETKAQRDRRLGLGIWESEPARDVCRAYEHIKDRLPPMWAAVLTIDGDAKLATIALKDGNGNGNVAKRLYRDDILEEHVWSDVKVYSKHVKWAWQRFGKTGK